MRALCIYESMFGNTRDVALAVAEGIGEHMEVETVEVGTAGTEAGEVDLLVVGGPTHAFGMSRPTTRANAADRGEGSRVSSGDGLREWLATLDPVPGSAVATFDTRVRRAPGSAARGAAKRLRRLGYQVLDTKSFWVSGTSGPVLPGEEERARRWGATLAETITNLRRRVSEGAGPDPEGPEVQYEGSD